MSGFKSNNLFRLLEWMASIAKAISRTAITEQRCIFDNQNNGWLFIAIVYGYMGPTWLINVSILYCSHYIKFIFGK